MKWEENVLSLSTRSSSISYILQMPINLTLTNNSMFEHGLSPGKNRLVFHNESGESLIQFIDVFHVVKDKELSDNRIRQTVTT